MNLVKYEAARHALAEAQRVDEVKDILDKATAMQVYAKQAKDRELIEMATDIKMRAERRAGELLREMPKNKGTQGQLTSRGVIGGSKTEPPINTAPKLSDLGISKKESSRWQKLADMPEEKFEEKLAGVKDDMRTKTEGPKPRKRTPTKKLSLEQEEELANRIRQGERSRSKLAAAFGVGENFVQMAIKEEDARQKILEAGEAVDVESLLSKTAQEKLAIAIRQHKVRLDAKFYQEVNAGVQKFLMETILPQHRKEQAEAKQIMSARRGVMDKATFNKVRRALHPDSRLSISDAILGEAFDAFMALEKRLLNERDSPTKFQDLPGTWQEWEAAKQKATETRKAKRTANQQPVPR